MKKLRTPILKKYELALTEFNDLLCYYLLSDVELKKYLDDKLLTKSKDFTTEIFPDNPFSVRIHVQADKLNAFREKTFNTLIGMIFVSSVECVINYMEEIEKYRSLILPTEHDQIKNEIPEDRFKAKVKAWSGDPLDSAIIKTVKYLRLRRNHVAHVSEEISQEYSSFVKNDSAYLNKYWSERETEMYDFSFSNDRYREFEVKEIFCLVNLCRVCMKIFDDKVASSISHSSIVKYEIKDFLKDKRNNKLLLQKKVRKFRKVLFNKYGVMIDCTDQDYLDYSVNT